jgi:hypothetical protein
MSNHNTPTSKTFQVRRLEEMITGCAKQRDGYKAMLKAGTGAGMETQDFYMESLESAIKEYTRELADMRAELKLLVDPTPRLDARKARRYAGLPNV